MTDNYYSLENLSDQELGQAFFKRLSDKGFKIVVVDYDGNTPPDPESVGITIEIHGAYGRAFEIDFLRGDFYRISGYQDGSWADEIDWKKY